MIFKTFLCVLQSEKERWSQATVQYETQQKTLCGDVLLTSAFVSYMGYFTRQYRVELLNNAWIPFLRSQKVRSVLQQTWCCLDHSCLKNLSLYKLKLICLSCHWCSNYSDIIPWFLFQVLAPLTDGLDPILMLTDDATVAAWHNQGLPNDRMSTENAAILTTSERWPLIIDPQQQGIKWIRNRLGSELRVVQLGQKG